jgi:adenylate cyclase
MASGLVLMAYLFTHFVNHAAGLVSLETAEAGRKVSIAIWRNLPATALFYGALLAHMALALSALYQRHTLRMPPLEFLRLVLGFSIPFLLAAHFTGTRVAYELYGRDDLYAVIASALWRADWGLVQLVLMLVAWAHGCLGLHFAFRHRPTYRRLQPYFIAMATLLPTLAYLGFVSMAREIAVQPRPAQSVGVLNEAQRAALSSIADVLLLATALLIALTLAARQWRDWQRRRSGTMVAISYPGRVVHVPAGFSVLEASRLHGIPQLSVCGGRARCSTCRVRVGGPPASLPPMEKSERETLARIGAGPDTRLACQLRPSGDIAVTPLLSAANLNLQTEALAQGVEREIAILFIDLRRWTSVSERHLPFDLAYVLDRYFTAVGDAVREAGGVPNQFIGDSVMAIFGLEADIAQASRQAITAAGGIERRMERLNLDLQRDFGQGRKLDFGIGLHAGTAVVGSVGYRQTRTLSAVGDAVNTASRLQELTKTYAAKVVVSDRVAQEAGLVATGWPSYDISVRGRAAPLKVYAVSTFLSA